MRRTLDRIHVGVRGAGGAWRPHREMPRFRWENFTTANGLPDDHVFNVAVDGNRVWAATENGLGLYENGKWKVYRPADGLAHRAVLFVAPDTRTGDVWVATMGGLSRFSAGRFDNFTQLNSGLPNDVVYGVAVQGDYVWVATAAGARPLQHAHGPMGAFQRAQHSDVRDLDLRRERRRRQGLLRGVGRRRAGVRRQDAGAGRTTTIPTARRRWCSTKTRD